MLYIWSGWEDLIFVSLNRTGAHKLLAYRCSFAHLSLVVNLLLRSFKPHTIKKPLIKSGFFYGRDERIWTSDFLHPMQALYQAELRPATKEIYITHSTKMQVFFAWFLRFAIYNYAYIRNYFVHHSIKKNYNYEWKRFIKNSRCWIRKRIWPNPKRAWFP